MLIQKYTFHLIVKSYELLRQFLVVVFFRSIAEVEPMEVTVNRPITYQIDEHGTNQGKRKLSDSRGFTYTVKVRDK